MAKRSDISRRAPPQENEPPWRDVDLGEWACRYGAALARFLSRRVDSKAEVADIIQDVYLKIVQRQKSSQITHPEDYIFRVALNALSDRRRRNQTQNAIRGALMDQVIDARAAFSPERILLGREAVAALEIAIRALPERTRYIFVLRTIEDLSAKEISNRIGISVRAVDKHYALGLARVAEHVAQYREY
jgi:RNA polymerase sigma factor (sigma-70 family)